MSIFHPLNMPVTAEGIAKAARDRLALTGEWTPRQMHVLGLIEANPEALVDFAERNAWTNDASALPPLVAVREEIAHVFTLVAGTVREEHLPDGWTESGDGILDEYLVELAIDAWNMADDLAAGVRRGDATITHEPIHGLDGAATRAWLMPHAANVRLSFETERFRRLDAMADGLFEMHNGEKVGDDVLAAQRRAEDARQLHAARQEERNADRIKRIVAATNENFALPADFALRYEAVTAGTAGPSVVIDWGHEPTRHKASFKRISAEVMTRPYGRHVIPMRLDALGEVSPFAVSEIARAGHHVALILGRDAEVVASGNALSQPPIWCRAGAVPVVAEIRGRLGRGEDVALGRAPFREMGAVIGMDIQLDAQGARYVANGETLEETLLIKTQMPHAVAMTCYGMAMSAIIEHPVVGRDDVFVEWMEIGRGETRIGLRSELVRLAPAPDGHEQNPTVAWISNMKTFDTDVVYGPRRYDDREANPEDPKDVHAPLLSRREIAELKG